MKHFTIPVDEGVNQILDKLVELKIDKNTIVWFLSDNGAAKKMVVEVKTLVAKKAPCMRVGTESQP